MQVGTVYTISNGRHSAKYLCIFSGPGGWDLKRVMLAKSKADQTRFANSITINIGPKTIPEKKTKK